MTGMIGQQVSKGDIIAYSGASASGFEHLHFEIRVGGRYQRHCCNPWKFLPNANNDYSSLTANMAVVPNPGGANCEANVKVGVPPDQLTVNRVQLVTTGGQTTYDKDYDMCRENLAYTFSQMDDPEFFDHVTISPAVFSSSSYGDGEWAEYDFTFHQLPAAAGSAVSATATVYDVFGNAVSSAQVQYTCV